MSSASRVLPPKCTRRARTQTANIDRSHRAHTQTECKPRARARNESERSRECFVFELCCGLWDFMNEIVWRARARCVCVCVCGKTLSFTRDIGFKPNQVCVCVCSSSNIHPVNIMYTHSILTCTRPCALSLFRTHTHTLTHIATTQAHTHVVVRFSHISALCSGHTTARTFVIAVRERLSAAIASARHARTNQIN